jgi:hypothetical protein
MHHILGSQVNYFLLEYTLLTPFYVFKKKTDLTCNVEPNNLVAKLNCKKIKERNKRKIM